MKIKINLIVTVLLMYCFSSAGMNFPRVEKVGIMKHNVVYSSPKYKVKGNKAYVKMIARWGVHVYEVGVSEFNCSNSGACTFNQWISLAMYEQCKVSGKRAYCTKKLSGSSISNSDNYSYASKGYLETYEAEYERENSSNRQEVEFPERENGSWEYQQGLF